MRVLPTPDPVDPGQESVWDYPRPPAVEPTTEHVIVEVAGVVVADTRRAIRVLETSHPPSYYIPREDVAMDRIAPNPLRTWCEFKGEASYGDVVVGDHVSAAACWWYPQPTAGYETIAGAVTFYPSRVDRCTVDGEVVRPVEGGFYGGWITSRVRGPFKGGPGSHGW